MLGRDESMPYPSPSVEPRQRVEAQEDWLALNWALMHQADHACQHGDIVSADGICLVARAVIRHVPAPPAFALSTPVMTAAADEYTTRVGILGVMESIPTETSDGVCEPSDDSGTRPANLDLTVMYDPSIHDKTRR
jgi:hypothetical protein